MTLFEQYLIELGYKRFRKEFYKKQWRYIPVDDDNSVYSTMVSGWLDYRYILDGDEKTEITFGLNEKGKPPTLCYPRPKGIYEDDEMNKLLQLKTPDEIYKLINASTP